MAPRNTRQKAAIRGAFETANRPLSASEVLSMAQAHVDGLGLATVYRTVKCLVEEGWLTSVELPGEQPRYEIAGKGHHHHFRCDACGRVFELNRCPPAVEDLAAAGFSVRRHELVLYGLCSDCQALAR